MAENINNKTDVEIPIEETIMEEICDVLRKYKYDVRKGQSLDQDVEELVYGIKDDTVFTISRGPQDEETLDAIIG